MKLNSSNHNLAPTSCGASLATRTLAEVFTPSPEDIATLTTQYRKAVNGLYEAYRFGQMLAQVKARLEAAFGDAARGTAEISGGKNAIVGGWNAGTGLKAWLAEHCPEINYSTARRFLAIAEKTNAALAAQGLADSGQRTADSRVPRRATRWASRPLSTAQMGQTNRAPALSAVGCPLSANIGCAPLQLAPRPRATIKTQT